MTELEFIRETLDELAIFARMKHAMRESIEIAEKTGVTDLVTDVDLEIQRRIARRVAERYPDDRFVAEEAGLSHLPDDQNARAWVVDPIDGTQNFVRGMFPAYGISIALAQGGVPVAAGVAVPGAGQLYLAERGAGATRNGERIRVSTVAEVSRARAEVDFSSPRDRAVTVDTFTPLMKAVGQVRCHCAAVIGLCSVATGDMDAYVHIGLNPWDFAAAMLIVEEAGGKVTRLDGRPIRLFDGSRGVLGSNAHLHNALVELVPRPA